MKLLTVFCALAWIATGMTSSAFAAAQGRGYVLRDTTSLPRPAAGKARLVVARDMWLVKDLKPEFVFVDRMPVGMLPQRTVVTAEVEPGWHRVWLGRGSNAEVWMEFAPDASYLLRVRETDADGTWEGDMVREAPEGYAQFALGKEMQLAIMDDTGREALLRHEGNPSNATAKQDSIKRANAIAKAALPIVIEEGWYMALPSKAAPGDYHNNPVKLSLDERSLRFTRADTTVLEIPRTEITDVRFGSEKGGEVNPWIKIGYREGGTDRGAAFADAKRWTSTENYNRLFAELAKHLDKN